MACASRIVSIGIKTTKKHKKHKTSSLCFLCFLVTLFGWRRSCRGCRRILAVEVGNERARDVDAIRGVQQRHLRSVDDHVNATRFGKSFERLANLVLQRSKEFLATTIVGGLRVLAFTLNVFLQLVQLIDLDRKS